MTLLTGMLLLSIVTLISALIGSKIWYSVQLRYARDGNTVPLAMRFAMTMLTLCMLAPPVGTMAYLVTLL